MRRKARTDANQQPIMDALRKVGCLVKDMSKVGEGFPDLLVLRPNGLTLLLLEVKDGSQPPCERQLTKDQKRFHAEWPVTVVLSVQDALDAVASRYP